MAAGERSVVLLSNVCMGDDSPSAVSGQIPVAH